MTESSRIESGRARMPSERYDDPLLFALELDVVGELSQTRVSPVLRQQFGSHRISLSPDSTIAMESEGRRWVIHDSRTQRRYTITRRGSGLSVYASLHVVNRIVDRGLCVRCGACEPACPVDIIRFDDKAYPYLVDEGLCIATCTRCLKVCPGEVVDFSELDREMFGTSPDPRSITGIVRRAAVAHATDDSVRRLGTSGGLVTQLLACLLEKRVIDGALVLGASTERGTWQEQAFIAREPAALKRAMKSKYIVTPFLRSLKEIEAVDGGYAVVGLPCYVHALRRYQKVSRKLRERVKLVIGLYCNVVFEPHMLDDLCELQSRRKEDVVDLQFRYGEWPGGVVAEFHDSTKSSLLRLEEMKDQFNVLKLLYTAPRCNMCIDFSAEYADLAVGDPWLRGRDGAYLFEDNRTTVLVRTEIGERMIEMAEREGYIGVQDIPLKTYMANFEANARYKRDFVPKNILMRKLVGLGAPDYNRKVGYGKVTGLVPFVLRTAILVMARLRWVRKLALLAAQSRPAITYLAWNRRRKARRFAEAWPRLEKFAEELLPSAAPPPARAAADVCAGPEREVKTRS